MDVTEIVRFMEDDEVIGLLEAAKAELCRRAEHAKSAVEQMEESCGKTRERIVRLQDALGEADMPEAQPEDEIASARDGGIRFIYDPEPQEEKPVRRDARPSAAKTVGKSAKKASRPKSRK